MKTKIVMMTALLALLAAGCGKNNGDGRIRIFAENMTAAGNGSKVLVDPAAPVNGEQWVAGEYIKVNNTVCAIAGNDVDGYSVASDEIALSNGALYAIYPGQNFGGNAVTVDNPTPTAPMIVLESLDVDFVTGGHKVAFPMGAKADSETSSILFKHLTAGFQLTLNAASETQLTKLKVIVYGNGPAEAVTIDGVSYTVAWKQQGPAVPSGETGSITDRNVSYASEMNFNLKTDGNSGVTFTGEKKFCIPVTLATVNRISVIGYNGATQVFSKTSAVPGRELERNRIYPVAAIPVN